MAKWFSIFEQHQARIIRPIVIRAQQEVPAYAAIAEEEVYRRLEAALAPYFHDFDAPTPQHFATYWGTTAYQRAQQGIPLEAFLQVLLLGADETLHQLCDLFAADPHEQIIILRKGYAITATGIAAVYAGYSRHKDEIIAAQTATLTEIASPIVPVHEGILVLPLIGAIESQRANQIVDGLLQAINTQRASVVIIDITGVPVIDTAVANYVLQAAQAARLLGATAILVGVSPAIAQTMVQLGIDLSALRVRANLQAGIEDALAMNGLSIGASHILPTR